MKLVRGLFDFYINSSMHVAFAVLCLSLVTQNELHLEVGFLFNCFLFFGTITGYNFVKYASLAGLHHRNPTDKLKIIQAFSFLCFLILLIILFQFEFQFYIYCIPLALLTLFYALPVMPQKRNLRHIPTLKIFIIAAVWSGVTTYLPVVYKEAIWDWDVTLILVQRFLFVLALIIPFEIRDVKYDSELLGTLPQLLGIKKTKLFGLALLAICVTLEFFKVSITPYLSVVHYLIIGLTGLAILRALKNQSTYYASFFVEGIPILWYLFVLIFSQFPI
tara:strand:- start:2094 stop:2921 length:828 start_codon:yes stop_codon:yes gene_type:complete